MDDLVTMTVKESLYDLMKYFFSLYLTKRSVLFNIAPKISSLQMFHKQYDLHLINNNNIL